METVNHLYDTEQVLTISNTPSEFSGLYIARNIRKSYLILVFVAFNSNFEDTQCIHLSALLSRSLKMNSLIDMGEWIIRGPLMDGGCRRLVVWLDGGRNLSASVKDEMNFDPVTVRLLKAAHGARCPLQWPGPTLSKIQRLGFSGGSATLILGVGTSCAQTAARAVASLRGWGGWDSRGRLLLVAGAGEEAETLEVEVQKTAKALWKELSADALILIQTQDSPRLFSFNPYGPRNSTTPKSPSSSSSTGLHSNNSKFHKTMASSYSNKTLRLQEITKYAKQGVGENLYYDKVKNLHGHDVRVSLFPIEPSLLPLGGDKFKGPDANMMNLIVSHINAKYKTVLADKNTYGRLLKNGTLTGSSGDIAYRRADVALNSRYIKLERIGYVEYLYPHQQSNLRIVVPNSEKLPQYISIILPFEQTTWICVMGSLVLAVGCYWVMNQLSSFTYDNCRKIGMSRVVMLTFAAFLSISLPKQPIYNMERIFLLFWVWYSLLITTIFQGGFTSYLAVTSYHSPIDTTDELYSSNLPISMHAGVAEIWIQEDVKDALTPFYDRIIQTRTQIEQESYTIAFSRNISAMTTDLNWFFSVQDRRYLTKEGRSLLHVMKQRILMQYQYYEIGVNSPFIAKFNMLIHQVNAAGLIGKWYADAMHERVANGKLAPIIGNNAQPDPTKIQLAHVMGPFMLLGAGSALGILALIFEMLRHKRFVKIVGSKEINC